MAVVDAYNSTYFDASGALLKLLPAIKAGSNIRAMYETVEVAAADDDGSKYRLFKAVDGNIIPLIALGVTDGITGMTDVDFGCYLTNLGAVVLKDCLADGMNFSSALDAGTGTALDMLDNVDIANVGKKLYEIAGHTELNRRDDGYDLVITANTVGSGAGTIGVLLIYAD